MFFRYEPVEGMHVWRCNGGAEDACEVYCNFPSPAVHWLWHPISCDHRFFLRHCWLMTHDPWLISGPSLIALFVICIPTPLHQTPLQTPLLILTFPLCSPYFHTLAPYHFYPSLLFSLPPSFYVPLCLLCPLCLPSPFFFLFLLTIMMVVSYECQCVFPYPKSSELSLVWSWDETKTLSQFHKNEAKPI